MRLGSAPRAARADGRELRDVTADRRATARQGDSLAPAFKRVAEIAQGFFERFQPTAAVLRDRIGGNLFSVVEMSGSFANLLRTGFETVLPLLSKVGEGFGVSRLVKTAAVLPGACRRCPAPSSRSVSRRCPGSRGAGPLRDQAADQSEFSFQQFR